MERGPRPPYETFISSGASRAVLKCFFHEASALRATPLPRPASAPRSPGPVGRARRRAARVGVMGESHNVVLVAAEVEDHAHIPTVAAAHSGGAGHTGERCGRTPWTSAAPCAGRSARTAREVPGRRRCPSAGRPVVGAAGASEVRGLRSACARFRTPQISAPSTTSYAVWPLPRARTGGYGNGYSPRSTACAYGACPPPDTSRDPS